MDDRPTVFLVDDDKDVRDALKFLIESVDLPVQAFDSAIGFLEVFDSNRPGCLVLDVRMPGMGGLNLQERLQAEGCSIPIIIITGHGDVPMCVRAFEGGAFAFLEKPINHQELLDYVQRAIEQDRENRRTAGGIPDRAPGANVLTDREREVMELLVIGKSMKQIATQLNISIPTCSKHRSKVLEKMQVENDVELVRLVLTGKSSAL
jgi:FixJ family two-component response regulator